MGPSIVNEEWWTNLGYKLVLGQWLIDRHEKSESARKGAWHWHKGWWWNFVPK